MKPTAYTLLFLLLLNFVSFEVIAQGKLSATKIDAKQLPEGIAYEGKVKSAMRWTDSNGDNVVLLTETGEYRSPKFNHEEYDGTDAELFAYHFIIKDKKAIPTWKVYDFESDCTFDLDVSFDAFKVSDIDKNGFAEVWLVYKTSCHSDVSPAEMKVIMYENGKKHAMRGTEKILQGTNEKGIKIYDGGEYTFDMAFANAPESFRTFAKKLWNDNLYFVPLTEDPKKL